MDKKDIIQLQHIYHSFDNRKILNDFNLSIEEGKKYIFSAPSGFGKSTVFNMIMGFIEPDEGIVVVDEIKVDDMNIQDIRGKISYLPQNISLPNVSVDEFLEQVIGFSQNDFSMDKFSEWVLEVDLPENLLESRLLSLSGGEKQRLMLCICLAMNKPILLIDEGLSGVDNERAQKVLSLLANDDKLTVVYISHDETHASVSGFNRLEVR